MSDKTPKPKKRSDKVSLAPLTVEEALRGLLATKPPPKKTSKKKKSEKIVKSDD